MTSKELKEMMNNKLDCSNCKRFSQIYEKCKDDWRPYTEKNRKYCSRFQPLNGKPFYIGAL